MRDVRKMTKKQKRVVLKIEGEGKIAENGGRRKGNKETGKEGTMDEGGYGADDFGASHIYMVRNIFISAYVRYDYRL